MQVGSPPDQPLARLRDDLEISPGAPFLSGAPAWVIRDPVRHRFFQIGQRTLDVLSRWSSGSVERLKSRLFQEKGLQLRDEELDALLTFLKRNELLESDEAGTAARFAAASEKRAGLNAWPRAQKLLFFRVPLARPEPFLRATWPVVRPLFSREFVWLSVVMACLGVYLASRQAADIEAHFRSAFTWSGAALFLAVIAGIKVLHELGHAYQGIRQGLRVPVMGIAFFVFLPLLYTDITDAWRLRRRADRVMIDLGGVFVELALAVYATLLWCFLPDGALRTVVFAVATSSWVLSILINLNPFMRFDGYYLLSDSLGITNLQPRANALGRWALRRALFGLTDPPPEPLPARTRRWLVRYAFGVWAYRVFLFVSISLLVYATFFKVAGLLMLLLIFAGFIVKPVLTELVYWGQHRERIRKSPRSWITLSVMAAAIAMFFWPMSTRVYIPAVLEEAQQQAIFPPEDARLERVFVEEGATVSPGQTLFAFSVPDLPTRIAQSEARLALLQARRLGSAGDALERAEGTVIARMLEEEEQTLSALTERQGRLVVRATLEGTLRELSSDLDAGAWYARTHLLARVIAPGDLIVRGYISDADLRRIDFEKGSTFVADEVAIPRLDLTGLDVSRVAIDRLPDGYLARPNGGPIAVSTAGQDALRVAGVWFPVTASPLPGGEIEWRRDDRTQRGMIVSRSIPQSYASRFGNRVAQVLFRELSF